MDLRGKTVAITGANGFIGTRLIEVLRQKYAVNIRGLVRNLARAAHLRDLGIELYEGNLTNFALLDDFVAGADVVIHCAALLGKGPWEKFRLINVDATGELARLCVEQRVGRCIYVSSIEVYGRFSGRTLTEDTPIKLCGHEYADSKALGEQVMWEKLHGTFTEGVVIRPGMVYGPRSFFWTVRLYQMAANDQFILLDKGRGSVFPIYIDDLVDGIITASTHPAAANQTFNFVNEKPMNWLEWASDYLNMCGKNVSSIRFEASIKYRIRSMLQQLLTTTRPSRHVEVMTRSAVIPNDNAYRLLGWIPTIGYKEGMQLSEAWLRTIELLPLQNE